MNPPPVIALTPGEPAGIGPDITLQLAQSGPGTFPAIIVVIADPELLAQRAQRLGLEYTLPQWQGQQEPGWYVLPVESQAAVTPGQLDPASAAYVLATLDRAIDGCRSGEFAALVTGPVHKGIINDAGHGFTGHTEYLADATHTKRVVMMLTGGSLRVALATTHLPLRAVPDHITRDSLTDTIGIVHRELVARFGITLPRITVCGLNPHAGEGGHLGREEITTITPVIEQLKQDGLDLTGPVPADTAFTPNAIDHSDAILAMYHDQGLPVLKHLAFGQAVNITLGLPFVRTSVDHGTALDLASSGRAGTGSLAAALTQAIAMAQT